MATKVKEVKIDQLIPDDLNANKGTEYGHHLMEKSFRELGAGRSILLDRNGKIIAGNKSTETASAIGLEDVIVVETDGTKLVAVKRMDIDIDSKQGRELALADNATSKANLEWDEQAVQQISDQWDIKPDDWGVNVDFEPAEDEEQPEEKKPEVEEIAIIVTCSNELDQALKLDQLVNLGFQCRKTVVIGSKTKEVKSK